MVVRGVGNWKINYWINVEKNFVSYESEFCFELRIILMGNATMFQFQDMFEIWRPNIVLKTVKSFNIKRASIKMLVLVFIINFYSDKRWDPKNPICAHF